MKKDISKIFSSQLLPFSVRTNRTKERDLKKTIENLVLITSIRSIFYFVWKRKRSFTDILFKISLYLIMSECYQGKVWKTTSEVFLYSVALQIPFHSFKNKRNLWTILFSKIEFREKAFRSTFKGIRNNDRSYMSYVARDFRPGLSVWTKKIFTVKFHHFQLIIHFTSGRKSGTKIPCDEMLVFPIDVFYKSNEHRIDQHFDKFVWNRLFSLSLRIFFRCCSSLRIIVELLVFRWL